MTQLPAKNPSRVNAEIMGRSLAILFFGGAVIGTLTYFLPSDEKTNSLAMFLLGSMGYPTALALYWFGDRIPVMWYHLIALGGTIILSLGLFFVGPTALVGVSANIYVWVPLWICYFFPLWQGMLHVAAIAILSIFPLVLVQGKVAATLWVTIVGTNLVAAYTVGSLAKRNRHLARVDALTGAFNRHEWEEAAEREMKRAERFGHEICLVYLDLDNFKAINDTLGHAAGDNLLRKLGESAQEYLRAEDVFARVGGDEFAILLPNCPEYKTIQIIERLGESLSEGCSMSVGIAHYRKGESWKSFQERTDNAMYAAKRAGKNTYHIAP